ETDQPTADEAGAEGQEAQAEPSTDKGADIGGAPAPEEEGSQTSEAQPPFEAAEGESPAELEAGGPPGGPGRAPAPPPARAPAPVDARRVPLSRGRVGGDPRRARARPGPRPPHRDRRHPGRWGRHPRHATGSLLDPGHGPVRIRGTRLVGRPAVAGPERAQ